MWDTIGQVCIDIASMYLGSSLYFTYFLTIDKKGFLELPIKMATNVRMIGAFDRKLVI